MDRGFFEAMSFLAIFIGIYGVLIIGFLVDFILRGFGIMRVSAALGFRNGFLGFIPYASAYQLGHLAGELELGSKRVRNPGLWMILIPIISGTVGSVIYVVALFGVMGGAVFSARTYSETAMMGTFGGLMFAMILMYLVIYVGGAIAMIIRLMVYNRIFRYFYDGDRPVFYLLLCAFVPFASGVLLMNAAKQPVMRPPAHADYGWQPPYNTPYGQPPMSAYPPPPEPYGPAAQPPAPPADPAGPIPSHPPAEPTEPPQEPPEDN